MATKPQTFDETILQRRNIGGSSVNELTLTPEEKRKEQILIAASWCSSRSSPTSC